MGIKIKKLPDGYVAQTQGQGDPWEVTSPMNIEALVQELLSRGWHQTDIGDAFYEADPDWVGRASS